MEPTYNDVTLYRVWDSDYEGYSVVFSCDPLQPDEVGYLWLLTRDQQPSADMLDDIHTRMADYGFDTDKLVRTTQNGRMSTVLNVIIMMNEEINLLLMVHNTWITI